MMLRRTIVFALVKRHKIPMIDCFLCSLVLRCTFVGQTISHHDRSLEQKWRKTGAGTVFAEILATVRVSAPAFDVPPADDLGPARHDLAGHFFQAIAPDMKKAPALGTGAGYRLCAANRISAAALPARRRAHPDHRPRARR
jgi:hypothetical protein